MIKLCTISYWLRVENDALYIFKYWTEFYTKQGLDYTVDLVTRFRTGQVPIVIDDYTYRNKIMVSAPERIKTYSLLPNKE